ncbi:MAG: hypothetical protein ACTSO9_17630 [Candidatus Helarchaeota archaeon]
MANTQVVMFAFFYELFGGAFLIIISLFALKRYLERRRNATLFLSCAILSLGAAILISSFGRLAALMTGVNPLIYHGYQYIPFVWIALALVCNIIGDIFFLLFTNDVFYNSNKKFTVFILLTGSILAFLLLLLVPTPPLDPINSEPNINYINLFQMIWLLHAIYTFFTGGLVTVSAFRMAQKDRPLVEKRGLQLIGITGICLAITNIMFVIDENITVYFGGDFSIFYYLAWIFAHVGVVFSYLGFILPNWLRKRWE